MTIGVTFNGTAITNPGLQKSEQTAYSFKAEIEGVTSTYADITALRALSGPSKSSVLLSGYVKIQTLGTKGSLVINGTTYTNCVIMDGVKEEEVHGTAATWWKYSAKFEQETI